MGKKKTREEFEKELNMVSSNTKLIHKCTIRKCIYEPLKLYKVKEKIIWQENIENVFVAIQNTTIVQHAGMIG